MTRRPRRRRPRCPNCGRERNPRREVCHRCWVRQPVPPDGDDEPDRGYRRLDPPRIDEVIKTATEVRSNSLTRAV